MHQGKKKKSLFMSYKINFYAFPLKAVFENTKNRPAPSKSFQCFFFFIFPPERRHIIKSLPQSP